MTADHFVYVYVDEAAAPLYVGCTNDPTTRYRAHQGSAAWWPRVADYAQMGPFPKGRALAVEANLIDALQPAGNVFGTVVRRRHPLQHNPAALRRARLRAGLRQADVQRALDLSPTYLTRAETGQRNIRADVLVRLAAMYGCDVDSLRAAELAESVA